MAKGTNQREIWNTENHCSINIVFFCKKQSEKMKKFNFIHIWNIF